LGDENRKERLTETLSQQARKAEEWKIRMAAIDKGNTYYIKYIRSLIFMDCGAIISLCT
jgi:hypothetical protein